MAEFLTPGEEVIHNHAHGHQLVHDGVIVYGSNHEVFARQIGTVIANWYNDEDDDSRETPQGIVLLLDGSQPCNVIVVDDCLTRLHPLDTRNPEEVEAWLDR